MSAPDSKINKLRKDLNSNDQPAAEHNESELSQLEDDDTPHDWKHNQSPQTDHHSILNMFLVVAGTFSLLAAGFAAVVIGFQSPSVSPEQVDISVSGPDTVSAGETTNLDISVTNNNKKTLEDVSVTVEFPAGTRQPDTGGDELRRVQRSLDNIGPNESKQISVAASLFGKQDETQQIMTTVEYSLADSNAIFSVNNSYAVTIGELPIAMDISAPNETAPGQPITFDITVQSNSAKTLNNVILRGEYPFGFTTTQTSPEPTYQDNVWSLGDLEPGEKREINISGRFSGGVDSGQRTIRFASGIARNKDDVAIETLFVERSQTLGLQAPLLGLSMNLGGDNNGQFSLTGSNEVVGSIEYQNNTDQPLRATEIRLQVNGESVDSSNITADEGLYRQSDQQITWNGQTAEKLETIAPGDSGELVFSMRTKDAKQLAKLQNPIVEFTANATAEPPLGTDLPNSVTTDTSRTAKVLSDVRVTTETQRNSDQFAVSGPYPPQVDKKTGYVLYVSVTNPSNDLTNVRLLADIPAYVSIVGDPQLSDGSFTYNETLGRMRWEINKLPAGAGYQGATVNMYIPITIRPTLSQVNTSPELLSDITLSAVDAFADETIKLESIDEPNTQAEDIGDTSRGSGSVTNDE